MEGLAPPVVSTRAQEVDTVKAAIFGRKKCCRKCWNDNGLEDFREKTPKNRSEALPFLAGCCDMTCRGTMFRGTGNGSAGLEDRCGK